MAGTLFSFVDQNEILWRHITDHALLLKNVAPGLKPIKMGMQYNKEQNTVTIVDIVIETLASETSSNDKHSMDIITGKIFPYSIQVFIICQIERPDEYCQFFDQNYWVL